ncbi:MAG: Metalloprotease TldD [Firmicutes bacterium]|nr:Metalloprotease TldD [candidate division NPL-UPA2 bacterium]
MLAKALLEDCITAALSTGGDFAEVFVEDRFSNTLALVGGKVDSSVSGREYGIGIRIVQGTNCVYAYTNDGSRESLLRVAKAAAEALPGVSGTRCLNLLKGALPQVNLIHALPHTIDKQRKVALMTRAYQIAKEYDPIISQVSVRYFDEDQHVQIANSSGLLVEDRRVRTRTSITAIASKGAEKQSGTYAPGAHMGFEFYDKIDIDTYAREAARIASTMIHADYAPSGRMPVIIDNEFGGVIFHEACGHSLEATSVAKKTSVFADKIGEKIASEAVSAVDDGTIPNAWGSLNVDDEGHPTRRNLLIENGILRGYLVDMLNGRRMQAKATGNSRRQSYKFAPTSRMTNTFILPGPYSKDEIIANTEYGLFARYMGGGSVNPATGEFNFAVNEAYMVRNGKVMEPVRGASLIGKGSEILMRIDMVANNLACGQGMCGSLSGSVPTDVGQPTLRVSEITVGGRKGDK